jgi:glucosyl-3-phosphoglycerate synthase
MMEWLTSNTFHHKQFDRLDELAATKRRSGLTVSVCIPTRNEGTTIGPTVRIVRQTLMEKHGLVDELVVIDAGSTDGTADHAAREGANVVLETEVLDEAAPGRGKGEALWKSLYVCDGDLICWTDADIANFDHRFVTGVLGPLLTQPSVGYVKAFYERPLRLSGELRPTGGGRVTELLARPLLNALWPHLGGIVQPLSGEFGGRRELLEQVPFYSGYGVELGLLIDISRQFGMEAIAQVDLESRIHKHQDLSALSRMSFTILQVALAQLRDEGRLTNRSWSTALAQFDLRTDRQLPAVAELGVTKYPPIRTVEAYRRRHQAQAPLEAQR